MQQYIFRIYLIALAVVVLTGCSKNLDQQPQSTAGNDAVFGSEDGLKLYTNSFYNGLPGISDVYKTDALADYSAVSAVSDYLREGGYNARTADGWTWTSLRNINYFIANCNNPAIPETVRNNYLGLARFFRAYFYFDKVKRYGNVPWIGKPISIDDNTTLYAGRDSRAVVMDSIIADLNFATANITLTADATSSQITKYVAYGLKSRVCLFEGTIRKYNDSLKLTLAGGADSLLQLAADAAKQVMDNGGYSLNQAGGTDLAYRQLFISAAPVATEVMLSNVASTSLAVYNDANWYYTSATYGSRLSFTRKFINTYLDIDGTPFTSKPGYATLPFITETQHRDKRLQQTIRMGSYTRTDNGKVKATPPVFSYTYTGYMPIKWSVDDTYYDNGANNVTSISLMRYAEILLNYAEAMAELGKLSDADWAKTVGALRTRAGITSGTTAKPVTVDGYMQTNYYPEVTDAALMEIRRERGIELALEGFRFYDLIRWNHGDLLANSWNGMYVPSLDTPMDLNGDGVLDVCFYQTLPATQVAGVTYINVSPTVNGVANPLQLSNGTSGEIHWLDNVAKKWSFYKYLYPIPYNDLQLNTKLLQNAGWEL